MRFRSGSLNVSQPAEFGRLTRTKSTSHQKLTSVDARIFIAIKEVSAQEALNIANKITNTTMIKNEWEYYNPSGSINDEQEKWNARYKSTHYILDQISSSAKDYINKIAKPEKKVIFFAAYFKGIPIGVLQFSLKNDDYPELPIIDYLVTHCGIRNCGSLLIEYALNKSQQLGMKGKLTLSSVPAAMPVYFNMGFTILDDGVYLQLNPTESNKWYSINGHYRFRG
ncbi:GNAT family N-acetyltransferase [Xenorhabdus sp. XENO-10]|uniref:GNAT family N-acetyltransferase n=1 Tax=Xenorhabdus yunnanensis TaxID=3025878 RepID=A0ABT5LFL3_9GAMM|nr:GNAT family N-acetyltransferase [Xenorhabdus yunnanensis]MDC9589892.1 GNAT family N-acetyltransferase [Xenorhabdus yunnanensis]